MESNTSVQRSRAGRYIVVLVLCLVGFLAWKQPSALVSLGSIISYQWRPKAPTYQNQTLSLVGLQKPVRVHFDPHGIPHIDASNEADLVRTTGYVQGRDRFFQMDVLRRIARGRLSELIGDRPFLGSSSVAFDRAMRGWAMEQRAKRSFRNASAKEKRLLTAFCEGVNAARQKFKHPEYKILGIAPEAFQPIDTYAIGMLNAWTISHNWQQELVRLLLAMHLGVKKASAVYPHTPLIKGLSLSSKRKAAPLPPAVVPALQDLFRHPIATIRPVKSKSPRRADPSKRTSLPWRQALHIAAATIQLSGNSNAWVINGERSQTGKPLLANDPHLSHTLPSLLYQQHLRTPQLEVIGVTIPGVPYVLIGHNKHVAWGMTAAVADVMDLVIEQPHPTLKDQVRDEAGVCALTSESIQILARTNKGMKHHTFQLRKSCRGPLLNDMYPQLLPAKAPMVAVQWLIGDVNLSMWSQASRAKNVKALYEVLHRLPAPVTTVQAADTQGNIGIFWAGTVPKRAHRGTFPYPGWQRQYQPKEMVPHRQIPFGYNPFRGYYAHGNNLLVDPHKSQHVLQIDSAPPYRVNRIKELLEAVPTHTSKSFAAIQQDVKLLRAAQVLPGILEDLASLKEITPAMKAARDHLCQWDHQASANSVGTTIFFAIYRHALRIAMREKLSPSAFQFFLSQRYTTNVTDAWFANKHHIAWDQVGTRRQEDRTYVVQRAFRLAVEQLRANQGDIVSTWRWGRLHKLQIRHPFGGIPLLGEFFNLPAQEGMGALASVWKSHFNMGNQSAPFRAVAGPAFRMIVDLADFDRSRWIIDTGSSGWPGTQHYGDQFQKWRKAKTVPMLSRWRTIIDTRLGTLLLLPRHQAHNTRPAGH